MRALLTLVAAMILVEPRPATAIEEPTLRVDADLAYACFADTRRYHGAMAGVNAGYDLSEYWTLRTGYGLGEHRSKSEAFRVHLATAGIQYRLDVLAYVPWLEVLPAAYLTQGEGGPTEGLTFGVAVGTGLDWLMNPTWSLGVAGHFHQMLDEDRFPAYLTLGVRLGYRWTLGDPFAP